MSTARFFFAIQIEQTLHQSIDRLVHTLKTTYNTSAVVWSRPENWHVTLGFLGTVSPQQLSQCLHYAAERIAQWPAFEFSVQKPSIFCGGKQAILALQVMPSPELTALHAIFNQALAAADLVVEKRNFFPHLTLGKLPQLACADIANLTTLTVAQKQIVEQIVLFASQPTAQGSVYTPVQHLPLKH